MTHCNAGALATCGWGTATAPLFLAHAEGLALHVWVSETRPRLQGANLTAWEMQRRGVPHTLFADAASALLMRRGDVDIVLVGADRVAAQRRRLQQDRHLRQGARRARQRRAVLRRAAVADARRRRSRPASAIPIEARSPDEVLAITGRDGYGQTTTVAIAPEGTRAVNYAFDVTPARLVTGLITERGIAAADRDAIGALFPERFR